MSDVVIDRAHLGRYLREHAEVLAAAADVSVDVNEEATSMSGVIYYTSTVRLSIENIPLSELEVE